VWACYISSVERMRACIARGLACCHVHVRTRVCLFARKSPCRTRVHGHSGIADLQACTRWLCVRLPCDCATQSHGTNFRSSAQPPWESRSQERSRRSLTPTQLQHHAAVVSYSYGPTAARNDSCCYVRRYPSLSGINNPCRRQFSAVHKRARPQHSRPVRTGSSRLVHVAVSLPNSWEPSSAIHK
jgi:hypothetical protein